MYSKEGQILVDVKSLDREGKDLVLNAKLMGAYTMAIYLKPIELCGMLRLLSWKVLRYMPLMLFRGIKEGKITKQN